MREFPGAVKNFLFRRSVAVGSGIGLMAGVILLTLFTLPTPPPDVWDDGLDDVAGFFFDKDFNRLPAEERLELLTEFIARFRDGGQEESVLLALFVADVTSNMRQQIEDNMLKLGVDLWSEWGQEYGNLPAREREQYINGLLVKLDKIGEEIINRESDKTDSERIAGMARQAGRDRQQMQERSGNKPADPDRITGFLNLYSGEVATRASPQNRAGIINLTRDITRHLRGESLDNGGGG